MTSSDHLIKGSCKIMGGELLAVYHYPDKFCDHKHCDREDIMLLIYHVTSLEQMFKELYEFMSTSHLVIFDSH